MGQSSRPCATPQPEPKKNWELMVEQFSRGADEGCSNSDLPITGPIDSTFLLESEELLRCTKRLGELIEQACAQIAHNHLLPLDEREEVKEASHDSFGRTSSCMDFQPLPPPSLTHVEEQENPFYDIVLHFALKFVLEDMNGKEEEVIEEEEVSIDEEEDLGCSHWEESNFEK
ncbi:unnamed protein product [Linum trigynum]|uniref:Uncharacterized protein n=1 Tax=Linum trigynum TaxID=586398 RepID=A0AAV2CFJ2_9ROSI